MSTEFTIGLNEGRNSSKVLRPPGGGSSNIFGTPGAFDANAKKQENLTKDRLFGAPEEAVPSPNRFHKMKSNIFGNAYDDTPSKGKKFVRRNPITGEVLEFDGVKDNNNGTNGDEENNGDHVTDGEIKPEEKAETSASGGVPLPASSKVPSIRVRQPPGGRSAGIF